MKSTEKMVTKLELYGYSFQITLWGNALNGSKIIQA